MVEVGSSRVSQGLERVGEELELASFQDWEPVQSSEVRGDVGAVWEVEEESSCGVLYIL